MNITNSTKRAINKSKRNNYKPTLDVQHNNYLQTLDSMTNRKQELKIEYDNLEKEYQDIQETINERDTDFADDELIKRMTAIKDKMLAIQTEVRKIEYEFDEPSYYTNTGSILFEYYDLVEKGDTHTIHKEEKPQPKKDSKTPTNSILDYFSKGNALNVHKNTDTKEVKHHGKAENSRGSLLSKYMKYTDPEYNKNEVETSNTLCEEHCVHCGSNKVMIMANDGYTWCMNCDAIEYVIVDHEKPSYRDPPKEISFFAYKRQNHLNEWISQIQGKETTEIPEEVYDKILMEIKKQKITNMAEITPKKIKSILKTLGIHKYYEHTAHIINRLTGMPMKQLSPELEEQLRNMFKMIQTPFLKHAPRSRKNFLSYSFVLHKMIQLLGKDEYLDSFGLLKSRDKLYDQDRVWRKICEELNWEFYPSL
jgi:uncharacterized Zn finger protein (UPF0148 family)